MQGGLCGVLHGLSLIHEIKFGTLTMMKEIAQTYFDQVWSKCNKDEKEMFQECRDTECNIQISCVAQGLYTKPMLLLGLHYVMVHNAPFLIIKNLEQDAQKMPDEFAPFVDSLFPMKVLSSKTYQSFSTNQTEYLGYVCGARTTGLYVYDYIQRHFSEGDYYLAQRNTYEVVHQRNVTSQDSPAFRFFNTTFSGLIFDFNRIPNPSLKNCIPYSDTPTGKPINNKINNHGETLSLFPLAMSLLKANKRVQFSPTWVSFCEDDGSFYSAALEIMMLQG